VIVSVENMCTGGWCPGAPDSGLAGFRPPPANDDGFPALSIDIARIPGADLGALGVTQARFTLAIRHRSLESPGSGAALLICRSGCPSKIKPPVHLVRLLNRCDGEYPHNLFIVKDAINDRIGPRHMQTIELSEASEMQRFFIAATSRKWVVCKGQASLRDESLAFFGQR